MAKRNGKTAQQATGWQNRIVGEGTEAPDQLLANPANWRIHPPHQREALERVLDTVGWVQRVIVNKNTGHVVDGHLRMDLADKRGEAKVPVLYVDLTEDEERAILATIDPISAYAAQDEKKLAELISAINDETALNAVLDVLSAPIPDPVSDPPVAPDGDDGAPPVEFQPYVYPSDNPWGVPSLMLSKQATALIEPVTKWGSVARTTKIQGTWHFYTDDYKFANLWNEPMQPVLTRCRAIIEPNYSTHHTMPRAEVLWGIYRKRWLGRFWQDAGMQLFVDVNVERDFFDLALLGVPKGWRAYANRAYTTDDAHLREAYTLACEHAGTDEIVYVVYGGRAVIKDLCVEQGWAWVPEDAYVKHGR